MKKIIFTLLLLPISFAFAAKIHDNEFSFKIGADNIKNAFKKVKITHASFKDIIATTGQPTGIASYTVGSSKIIVPSGRKKSEEVANSFNSPAIDGTHMIGYGTAAEKPKELNFYVHINTITISFVVMDGDDQTSATFEDLLIGQGHEGGNNNWWIAGPNCTVTKDKGNYAENRLECTSIEGAKYIFEIR